MAIFVDSICDTILSHKQKGLRSDEIEIIRPPSFMTIEAQPVEFQKTTPDEDADAGWTGYIIASTEQLIILIGLYVFSIGPMYWRWLGSKQVDGSYFIAVMYEPLWIVAGILPPFGEWLNWYVRLWIF